MEYNDHPTGCQAKKQTTIAQSTVEAGYFVTLEALQIAVWAQTLANTLQHKSIDIRIHKENMVALYMIKTDGEMKHSKNIYI